METNSCGEDLLIKSRKPYTITKQRERWSEEEHNRFIDALRLYGRAWQKIQDHVGTKTAVQIRSHAQKFFSKVEKEAEAKGVPVDQAIDIAIPPPRPKRKPNTPYPRKTASGITTPMLKTSVSDGNESLVSEKMSLPEIANEDQQQSKPEENTQEENSSDCFTHQYLSDAPSMNKSSIETSKTSTLREFLPSREQGPQTYPKPVPVVAPSGSSITTSLSNPHSKPDENHAPRDTQPHTAVEDYQSFPNHIMASLLQTPALYTAATLASSFYPPGSGQVNSPPNLAAMAAATVAAASAWWAANGLLPFTCYPPTAFVPSSDVHNTKASTLQHVCETNPKRIDPEYSEALKARSSLDSEDIENGSKPDCNEQPAETDGARDRKLVDRSSCGSNTSSEDVEAENASERQENDTNCQVKEVNANNNPQTSESNARRISSRISSNLTDPWKAVSDEGKIAFRALFSREVLPQSFAYQQEHREEEQERRYPMAIDLNCTAQISPNDEEGLEFGLGGSKLTRGRTGFKPYKRCSIEAKESRVTNVEQKDPKRIRLETQSST